MRCTLPVLGLETRYTLPVQRASSLAFIYVAFMNKTLCNSSLLRCSQCIRPYNVFVSDWAYMKLQRQSLG